MGLFRRSFKLCLLLFGIGALLSENLGAATAFPRPDSIPEGLGFNIHFSDPLPGEMKMLSEGGVRWVRADFLWPWIEKQPGKYDFSPHDRLLAALNAHGIRPIFILSYGHPFYDQGKPPYTEEGRRAFARWVAACLTHFRGKGVVWEMWNEPNIGIFWPPKPNVKDFILLAETVGKTVREVAPEEILIGPALSKMDFKFLEACFKAGLLEYWSAVSVHPYRRKDPETVSPDFEKLEELIARYTPPGRQIPIVSGEWGYSTSWRGIDEKKQGKYLPRQWLINLMHGIPLSIWYDWRCDGPDPKHDEQNYGSVSHPHHPDRDPLFDPRPAYKAAKTLTQNLSGFRFAKRLAVGGSDDYVLVFKKGEELRLAAWTRSQKTKKVVVPAGPDFFRALGHTGEKEAGYRSTSQGLCLPLTDEPQYLTPSSSNALLEEAAAWTPAYEHRIRGRERECFPIPAT